jgi:hypothetical protein
MSYPSYRRSTVRSGCTDCLTGAILRMLLDVALNLSRFNATTRSY